MPPTYEKGYLQDALANSRHVSQGNSSAAEMLEASSPSRDLASGLAR